jgi:ribonuclease E
MPNKMLIDASHPEETRVVVVRGNRVEEFDFEAANRRQLRGNIYLAKVTRVEPSLQACFVDYGGNRHGFLAFSEIHPDYYQIPVADRQALIEEEERAAREADERRAARHQARHARRDQTISEPAQDGENGGDASAAAETPHDDASGHSQIEEVPHDDEAPEEIGAHGDGPHEPEFAPHDDEPASPAREFVSQPYDEAAGSESGGAAEASEAMGDNGALIEDGEEQAGEARQEQIEQEQAGQEQAEDESVEQVGGDMEMEEAPERQPRRFRRYKIQEVIKRRQVLLVQVVKEERGTKGAALTTYLSLAGRYSVLMPNTSRGGGISRKITSSQDRQRLKELVGDLEVPEGMGVILRTAGASRTKPEIKRDFEYLLRLWETVRELTLESQAPALVYEEGSLTKRAIRDLYNKDTEEVIVAGHDGYKEAREFMGMLMPSHEQSIIEYKEKQPIFARYGVEHQLDAMFSPTVQLKSGGYIVINPTEALVSIDVNSGRSTREHHIEDTALKTNLEAAEEIARQLRLRDLAGLIVIDFIDMEEKRNNRHVERKLKDALRHDRARIQVGRISHFGLMEMSRQRIRTGVLESSSEICPVCGGTGHVRAVSSVALQLLRGIEDQLMKSASHDIIVRAKSDVAIYVLNHKRAHLRALEEQFGVAISIQADATLIGQQSFAIERGGIARQKPAVAAPRISPDSVAVEVGEDEEFADSADASLAPERGDDHETRDGEPEDQGSRRGGRRRRGRRGRGGSQREAAPAQRFDDSEGAPEGTLAGNGENGFDGESERETHGEAHEAHGDNGETHGESRNGENGETRKRRRRGRRGGRRNRGERDRSRDGAPSHEFEAHPSGSDFEAEGMPETNGVASFEPAPSEPAPPAPEPAPAAKSEPASEPTAASAPAPKRRSTVREAAPIVNFDNDAPAAETPKAAPVRETPGDAQNIGGRGGGDIESEPDQPRRSGWWSRLRGK